jgi:hypothetical protein
VYFSPKVNVIRADELASIEKPNGKHIKKTYLDEITDTSFNDCIPDFPYILEKKGKRVSPDPTIIVKYNVPIKTAGP